VHDVAVLVLLVLVFRLLLALDRESIDHQRNLDVLLFDAGQLDAERHLLVCSGDVNAGSQYSAHAAAKPVLEVGIKPGLECAKGLNLAIADTR
jgi:hypothetical protein